MKKLFVQIIAYRTSNFSRLHGHGCNIIQNFSCIKNQCELIVYLKYSVQNRCYNVQVQLINGLNSIISFINVRIFRADYLIQSIQLTQ